MAKEQIVLALNAGSSSLKASVVRNGQTIVSFLAERLNTPDASVHVKPDGAPKATFEKEKGSVMKHVDALAKVMEYIQEKSMMSNLIAVGHRVAHGGSVFIESTVIDDAAVAQLTAVNHLAPLHNPHNLEGIVAMRELLKDIPNVAVFDTSFHSSIPEVAYTYPLPVEYRNEHMRKFGFHGTSVRYVSEKATELLGTMNGNKSDYNMMVCHLGNGASLTAVAGDKSMDTSMGFTPLAGLMMGTRCGDVDPSLVSFAAQHLNKDVDQVVNDLNKNSGLKGMISDGESDMRVLLAREAKGDKEATLAVDMFVYRLAQQMAHYLIALPGPLQAVVFTAGIGEHSAAIRGRSIEHLAKVIPSLAVDKDRNEANGSESNGVISKEGSWPVVMVIPTDEEAMIAKECIRLVL